MRYIGNKTRLLPFLLKSLRRLGVAPGTAHDAFAGTAAVGRALKAAGWRVASSDVMTYSHVFQRAYVVADARLATNGGAERLAALAAELSTGLAPEAGFLSRHFAPAGGRMYFTDENAGRIDAARAAVHEWRARGRIDDDAYFVLLAAILEGADRVANTAGVYAAYIKRWQPNALRPFTVSPEPPAAGPPGSEAHLGDAAEVARRLGPIDLLYVDPPYNGRQYGGYYHVPEIIARGWFDAAPAIRGKTGLLEASPRSAWCHRRRAGGALRELLAATGARHVLVSYNSEGIIPDAEVKQALREASADGNVRRFSRVYKRYRADSDHARRRYRGDAVRELLYYARLR